jgi:hypothetical protein
MLKPSKRRLERMRLETLGAALGLKSYGGIPATLGAGGGQSNTSNEKEINNGLNAQEIVDKCSK